MATNLRAPVTEDIWHLSIDDLFAPLPEKPRLGGPGPFVINLSSSTAGIGLPTLNLAGCDSAHAYEIQRNEDGRTRYRLRLGPFETEEQADLLLELVREIYPSALTATAAPDDLKAIAAIRAKAAAAAEARRPPQAAKKPEPPMVTARVEPAAAMPQVAAPKAAVPAVAPTPAPAVVAKPVAPPQLMVLDDANSFNIDISFADIEPPKMPEPPVLNLRAGAALQSAAPHLVEPPVINERVEVKAAKPAPAAATASPAMIARVPLVPPPVAIPPVVIVAPAAPFSAASVVAAPAPPAPASPTTPVIAISPATKVAPATPPVVVGAPPTTGAPPTIIAQANAPLTSAAPTKKAAPISTTPYVSAAKKPASIWSSLPVAPRSTVHKPQSAVGKPSMSVSAPLVRRPAAARLAGASAAQPAAPAKPVAPSQPPAARAVAATPQAQPAVATGRLAPPTTTAPKTPHPQKPPAAVKRESPLSLESTQTMRAITKAELEDENALPWFVIELATSNQAFDPDTVPNLDIFAEYRLYSVVELGNTDIVHSLRVGFFSAEIAAKAVASYLSEYYDKPAIKRVSLAERERFQEQAVEARKDVGATGRHAVIEITDDLVARRKRSTSHTASP